MKFYAHLFPGLILPARLPAAGPFQEELRALVPLSRKLGRSLMIALARFGPKLERAATSSENETIVVVRPWKFPRQTTIFARPGATPFTS